MAYPNQPGSKGGGASADAAEAIKSRVGQLRDRVATLMLNGYHLTADEIAKQLGETVLAIRPRVSELVKAGVLVKLTTRRKNVSGQTAHILRHAQRLTPVDLPEPAPVKRRSAPAVHHDQNAFFG